MSRKGGLAPREALLRCLREFRVSADVANPLVDGISLGNSLPCVIPASVNRALMGKRLSALGVSVVFEM